jgi:hypothetical protein
MGVAASRRLQPINQYHRKPIWGFTQMFAEGRLEACKIKVFPPAFWPISKDILSDKQ